MGDRRTRPPLGAGARGDHLQREPGVVSAASAWEIATKHRLGTLPGAEIVVSAHRDPFDRMLAAQAAIEGLTLGSSDTAFDAFGRLGVALSW